MKERENASHGSFSFEWDTDDVAGIGLQTVM
jgi:hypothetical protein